METDQRYSNYQPTTRYESNDYPLPPPPRPSDQPSGSYSSQPSAVETTTEPISPISPTSILDRGRPKPKPRPSSFFGLEESNGRLNEESSGENRLEDSQQDYNGAEGELSPEETFRRGSGPDGIELGGRRSSFYGVEADAMNSMNSQAGQQQYHSQSNGNGNGNGQFGQKSNQFDSESNSFSSNEIKNRYNQSNPLSQSRSTSLYGLQVDKSSNTEILSPLLDQSHLKPGVLASLLTHEKTLDLYRANAKKSGDVDVQFEFCTFVMEVVGEMESFGGLNMGDVNDLFEQEQAKLKQNSLVQESVGLLLKLANRGHMKSQYFLADCYTQGIGTVNGKRDFDKAFPLFVLAAKHGHVDACFRAAQCAENGWGCKKDFSKACALLRKAAVLGHPPAMHRLGLAEMNGEIGLTKRPREGVKWLKRAAELADQVDPPQPQSLHELAILNENGIDNIIFVDLEYAGELYARAAELSYAPSAYKLGESYEYGKMGCPQDAALSIHYYNIAAQQNHREACFALTAWYLVGSPGVLPQSDTEAYLWAKKAAEMGLAKAEYAVGYFTEVGIGTYKDASEAINWFQKAADHGDKRAKDRLRMASMPNYQQSQQPDQTPLPSATRTSNYGGGGGKNKNILQKGRQSNVPLPLPPPPPQQQKQGQYQGQQQEESAQTFVRPKTESNNSKRSEMPRPIITSNFKTTSPPLPPPPPPPPHQYQKQSRGPPINLNDPYSQFDQIDKGNQAYKNSTYVDYDSPLPNISSSLRPSTERKEDEQDEQDKRNKLLSKRNGKSTGGKEKEDGDGCLIC